MMYDYITKIQGCPQYPVKPWLIYSTNDTKPYVFEGLSTVTDKVNIVTKESVKKSGTNAIFRIDDGNLMKGMQVDMSITFLAHGTSYREWADQG